MEQMTAQKLPPDMGIEWTGMSYQEKLVGNQAMFVFALSVLLVFLVLAAQYESWSSPAAVILVVPLALLGTVLALSVRGYDNNIYTQIGMVLLIALASKNAILIVEVARELRAKGVDLLRSVRGGVAAALSPDPHDLVCLHPGSGAAGSGDRGRGRQPPRPRHRGHRRYARVDPAGRPLCADLLRHHAALERMAGGKKEKRREG